MTTTAEAEPTPSEGRDTARSSVVVAAGILLSRLGGLIREIALAATLGTSIAADAFRGALRIPQLLQNLLGEGALSAAFIPVYARLLEEGRSKEAGRLAGAVGGLIAASTAVLVLAGAILARPLTSLLAPGFTGETYELTVRLVRIMTAGIGFVVLAAWCLGVLNAHRKFFLPYAAPVVWNAAQIGALAVAGVLQWSDAGIAEAAAWGVLLGGVLQFVIQLPSVLRVVPELRWSVRTDQPETRTVLRRFGPAVAGRGVLQIGAYLDLLLASLLVTGSVAAMDFAQILYLLPISLFAVSIAAAELPELSRTTTDDGLAARIRQATARVSFFLIGSALVFILGGATVVAAVYQHGAFTADDTTLVWLILAAYAIGLIPSGVSRVVQNGLFARGDTAGPARIALVRVVVAAALGAVLMFQFEQFALLPTAEPDRTVLDLGDGGDRVEQVGDLPASIHPLPADERGDPDAPARLGVVGLALGSAIGAWIEYLLLERRLKRRVHHGPGLIPAAARLAPATLAGGTALVVTQVATGDLPAVVAAAIVLGASGAVYVGVAWLTGVSEVRTSSAALIARLPGRAPDGGRGSRRDPEQ